VRSTRGANRGRLTPVEYELAFTTGLDHAGFVVPSRSDLVAWQDHLESNGVVRADVADKPYGSVLVFRDPDNIQLELFSPAAH
jgi:glyoxylase I family protein